MNEVTMSENYYVICSSAGDRHSSHVLFHLIRIAGRPSTISLSERTEWRRFDGFFSVQLRLTCLWSYQFLVKTMKCAQLHIRGQSNANTNLVFVLHEWHFYLFHFFLFAIRQQIFSLHVWLLLQSIDKWYRITTYPTSNRIQFPHTHASCNCLSMLGCDTKMECFFALFLHSQPLRRLQVCSVFSCIE